MITRRKGVGGTAAPATRSMSSGMRLNQQSASASKVSTRQGRRDSCVRACLLTPSSLAVTRQRFYKRV